jgi:hypothetical protein
MSGIGVPGSSAQKVALDCAVLTWIGYTAVVSLIAAIVVYLLHARRDLHVNLPQSRSRDSASRRAKAQACKKGKGFGRKVGSHRGMAWKWWHMGCRNREWEERIWRARRMGQGAGGHKQVRGQVGDLVEQDCRDEHKGRVGGATGFVRGWWMRVVLLLIMSQGVEAAGAGGGAAVVGAGVAAAVVAVAAAACSAGKGFGRIEWLRTGGM